MLCDPLLIQFVVWSRSFPSSNTVVPATMCDFEGKSVLYSGSKKSLKFLYSTHVVEKREETYHAGKMSER